MVVSILRGNKWFSIHEGARYSGEKIPGDLDGWDALDSDPNRFLEQTYDILSRRSITLYHTYPPVTGAVEKQTDYAIGKGLLFRSRPNYRVLGMKQVETREWARNFQQLVEFEFARLNFPQKQGVLFRTALIEGDSLLYFLRDGDDIDLVDMPGSVINSTVNDDTHKLGIEHDKWLRRTGFVDRSGATVKFRDGDGRQNVAQFCVKRMSRQLRGWPLSYAVISLAKNDDRHTDATLTTAVAESMIAWITDSDSPESDKEQFDNLIKNTKVRKGPVAVAMEKLGNIRGHLPGGVLNFRSGGKLTALDKKTPSSTFDSFKKWMLDYVGMATGTPPEVITSKYSTSYTAHKGAINDFTRSFISKRQIFIDSICYPVLREITINLILRGEIDAPGFFTGGDRLQRAWLDGVWKGPTVGAINPNQEIAAEVTKIKEGLVSRSDVAYEVSGDTDYMALSERRREDEELFTGKPGGEAAVAGGETRTDGDAAQPDGEAAA